MEFMFDTADLKLIRRYEDMIPYTGITTNPALIRKAGIRTGLFDALREIHRCVSSGKSLHIQVVSHDSREMIREAMYIRKQVGEDVCIKVPVTPDGMTAMKYLKTQGVRLTATTVVTPVQAMLALELEPDFIAPYYTQRRGGDPPAGGDNRTEKVEDQGAGGQHPGHGSALAGVPGRCALRHAEPPAAGAGAAGAGHSPGGAVF